MRLTVIAAGFLVCAAMLVAPVSSSAQSTPLARLDCTSGNFPDCGWHARPSNPYFTQRLLQGGGPQGQDAVEVTHVPSSSYAQYYVGWTAPSLPAPSPGAVRYVRVRLRTVPPINLYGTGDIWTSKFIILGDGDNPTGRVICQLIDNGISPDNLTIHCSRNIDGFPNATSRVPIPPGVWNTIQFEFRSSSSSSSGDGRLKIWMNSGNYSAPSSQSGSFQLNVGNWGNFNVGYYVNTTLRSDGRVVYQLADVEFDDQFDASFIGSGGGSATPPAPPAAPTNIRILGSGLWLATPLAGAFALWLRRRQTRRS